MLRSLTCASGSELGIGGGQVECTEAPGYPGRSMGVESTNVVVVMVAAADQDEAVKIADQVVRLRLAACASTLPTVRSTYWWEGKVVNEQESLVLIKTTADKFTSLQETIQRIHSYKVPEIIALPVVNGFLPYLEWVHKETS
jgi:periplasmic divalent cation tolerance protein